MALVVNSATGIFSDFQRSSSTDVLAATDITRWRVTLACSGGREHEANPMSGSRLVSASLIPSDLFPFLEIQRLAFRSCESLRGRQTTMSESERFHKQHVLSHAPDAMSKIIQKNWPWQCAAARVVQLVYYVRTLHWTAAARPSVAFPRLSWLQFGRQSQRASWGRW